MVCSGEDKLSSSTCVPSSYTISIQCSVPAVLHRQCIVLLVQHNLSIKCENRTENQACNDQAMLSMESPPPHQESPNHILNTLNDDCLLELFESPVFSLWDLVTIANVCTRFHGVAKKAFRTKSIDDKEIFRAIDLWRMEEFFCAFGELITSIDLSENESTNADIMLWLLLKHCTNITNLECKVCHTRTVCITDLLSRSNC